MREQQPRTQATNMFEVHKNSGGLLNGDLRNQVVYRETHVPLINRGIPVAGFSQPW
jgi:hypothetical protein